MTKAIPQPPTINLAPGFDIPIDAVTESFSVLGKRGSGKTVTANVLAEGMLDAGQQSLIIDPTNASWGLQSSADGKSDGYPIPIFGGRKGNMALDESMGRDLADALIETRSSAIVCVRDFSKSGARRFVGDFAEQLYDRKCEGQFRTPLHLFIDEADAFVPQKIQKGGERAFGAIDTIVRRGRLDGFGTSLISQRPAVINKDVLSQTEVLVAHQLPGPHDQRALFDWIKEQNGSDEQKKEFTATLASLRKGEAWFWSPTWLEVFRRVQVRMRSTWDSSRTPKVGEVLPEPERMATVDIEAIKSALAPKATASKAGKGKPGPRPPVDVSSVDSAELEGLREENARLRKELAANDAIEHGKALDCLGRATRELDQAMEWLSFKAAKERAGLIPNSAQTPSPPRPQAVEVTAEPSGRLLPKPARTAPSDLPQGQAVILGAVIQHHPTGCTREQLTVLTGYKRSSRDTYLQKLKQSGLIEDNGAQLTATKAGLKKMPDVEPLPTGKDLLKHWLENLPRGEALVLSIVPTSGKAITRDYISERTGYQRSSRDTYLQKLAARRLIVATTGGIALSEHLR